MNKQIVVIGVSGIVIRVMTFVSRISPNMSRPMNIYIRIFRIGGMSSVTSKLVRALKAEKSRGNAHWPPNEWSSTGLNIPTAPGNKASPGNVFDAAEIL